MEPQTETMKQSNRPRIRLGRRFGLCPQQRSCAKQWVCELRQVGSTELLLCLGAGGRLPKAQRHGMGVFFLYCAILLLLLLLLILLLLATTMLVLIIGADGRLPIRPRCGRAYEQFHSFMLVLITRMCNSPWPFAVPPTPHQATKPDRRWGLAPAKH